MLETMKTSSYPRVPLQLAEVSKARVCLFARLALARADTFLPSSCLRRAGRRYAGGCALAAALALGLRDGRQRARRRRRPPSPRHETPPSTQQRNACGRSAMRDVAGRARDVCGIGGARRVCCDGPGAVSPEAAESRRPPTLRSGPPFAGGAPALKLPSEAPPKRILPGLTSRAMRPRRTRPGVPPPPTRGKATRP
jgi:hypothetical protein